MSIRLPLVLGLAAALLGLALAGLWHRPHAGPAEGRGGGARQEFTVPDDPGFRAIPLQEAVRIAGRRFHGRLIAAQIRPPNPAERARGVELVHELRLMTRSRDVLMIRLDARTGAFLEVAGSGLSDARRKKDD